MHDGRGAVNLGRVLMGFTGGVTGEHGGLLVYGRGASVCRPGIVVPRRGVSMRPPGSLH